VSNRYTPICLAGAACALAPGAALAQLDLSWRTVDGGGGTSTGAGGLTLSGTAGQPDAGTLTGAGGLELRGGYWGATVGSCYANCDGSTVSPILNVQDFSCFLSKFAASDPYANCDGSTQVPVLNVQDFSCFLGKFAAGCP
jgi:hypothetical protein